MQNLAKEVLGYICEFYVSPSCLLHILPLVSKRFYDIATDEKIWEQKCSSYGFDSSLKSAKSALTIRKWFFDMEFMKFDKKINDVYIDYSDDGLELVKKSNIPDANIAIVQRKITSGIAFCEFLVAKKSDEMWIGVTTHPQQLATITGWGIVNNPHTWAYNDRRTGIEFGPRHGFNVERYYTGDKIGVLVDKDEGVVSFYKNGIHIGSSEGEDKLPTALPVYFFVMVDYAGDTVSICKRY